jgi:hypothetical protein
MKIRRHRPDPAIRRRFQDRDGVLTASPFQDPELLALAWTLSVNGGRIPLLP